MFKECIICGKSFTTIYPQQKICNDKECKKIGVKKSRRRKYVPILPRYKKTCEHCGKDFMTSYIKAKFCSDECRYEAKKEAQRLKNRNRKTVVHRDKNHDQPCWTCKNYINGCNWSRNLKPVQGWNAELIKRPDGETYRIYSCPEYIYSLR